MSEPIAAIRVHWVDFLDLDTANPFVNIAAHCFDATGVQMAGWGFRWSKRAADLSAARIAALTPWRNALVTYAAALARAYDLWLPTEATITVCLVQLGRYPDGGVGINVGYHRGEGREFVGQLALEYRNGVMTVNQRGVVPDAEASEIVTRVEQVFAQAEALAWRLRVERL